MINKDELVFTVDENNNPVEPEKRSFVHKNGLWHRTSGVWVINRKEQILCQKRSLKKDVKPGMWEAFFGGHLAPNEDYKDNAANEVREELGIKINKESIIPYKVLKSDKPTHKEFQYVCALILEKLENFDFEKDEIDEIMWRNPEEVREILLVKNDPHWVHKPWDKEVLNWLSDIT